MTSTCAEIFMLPRGVRICFNSIVLGSSPAKNVHPMKSLLRFAPVAVLATSVAQAHPGHDGHELVWEYSAGHIHLAGLIWVAVVAVAVLALYRYAKSRG